MAEPLPSSPSPRKTSLVDRVKKSMCSVFRRSSGRFKLHEAIQEGKALDWSPQPQHWLHAWCMVSSDNIDAVEAAWSAVRPHHACLADGDVAVEALGPCPAVDCLRPPQVTSTAWQSLHAPAAPAKHTSHTEWRMCHHVEAQTHTDERCLPQSMHAGQLQ